MGCYGLIRYDLLFCGVLCVAMVCDVELGDACITHKMGSTARFSV